MENHKERHKSLIKINRRVFSHDYVPPEMFTSAWLMENRHIQNTERLLFGQGSQFSEQSDDALPASPENEARESKNAGASKE